MHVCLIDDERKPYDKASYHKRAPENISIRYKLSLLFGIQWVLLVLLVLLLFLVVLDTTSEFLLKIV